MAGAPQVVSTFSKIQALFAARPYAVNSSVNGTMMALGDRVAQHIEAERTGTRKSDWDSWSRTGILSLWSGAIATPYWAFWYLYLARRLPNRQLLWVGLTALIPGPLSNAAFFAFSTLAEHAAHHPRAWETREEAFELLRWKYRELFVPTVLRSAQLWLPFNTFNFLFVPLEFRLLAGTVVGLGWNVYLSLVQHSKPGDEAGGAGTTTEAGAVRAAVVAAVADGSVAAAGAAEPAREPPLR
jgi:protein Mpv17